jgi:hypothetical protein
MLNAASVAGEAGLVGHLQHTSFIESVFNTIEVKIRVSLNKFLSQLNLFQSSAQQMLIHTLRLERKIYDANLGNRFFFFA